jgi:hypothetical protein
VRNLHGLRLQLNNDTLMAEGFGIGSGGLWLLLPIARCIYIFEHGN